MGVIGDAVGKFAEKLFGSAISGGGGVMSKQGVGRELFPQADAFNDLAGLEVGGDHFAMLDQGLGVG